MSDRKVVNVLSFGGGVQTTAIAAMSCLGDLPMPDFAVFADTQVEREASYDYLKWFVPWCAERGLKIYVGSHGNLGDDFFDPSKRAASLPLYTKTGIAMPSDYGGGRLMRQCTRDYKINVVRLVTRRVLGYRSGQRMRHLVRSWIGISIDEAHRMKEPGESWSENHYPLIDNRMSRASCVDYLNKKGLPKPPKSACYFCPFHSDDFWIELRREAPGEFEKACVFDDRLRTDIPKRRGLRDIPFLHSSRRALRDVGLGSQGEMFGNECEGYCGV